MFVDGGAQRFEECRRTDMNTSAAAMTAPMTLPQRARVTGAIYLPYFAFGLPLFLRARLIVPTNANATAAKILASQSLYRATIVSDLVSYGLYIALAYLFYTLIRPVNRSWEIGRAHV